MAVRLAADEAAGRRVQRGKKTQTNAKEKHTLTNKGIRHGEIAFRVWSGRFDKRHFAWYVLYTRKCGGGPL